MTGDGETAFEDEVGGLTCCKAATGVATRMATIPKIMIDHDDKRINLDMPCTLKNMRMTQKLSGIRSSPELGQRRKQKNICDGFVCETTTKKCEFAQGFGLVLIPTTSVTPRHLSTWNPK